MATTVILKKAQHNALIPATARDLDLISICEEGRVMECTIKSFSPRSLQHHKLYWGGLIPLVKKYWRPQDGLISDYDKRMVKGMVAWAVSKGQSRETWEMIVEQYLDDKMKKIADCFKEYEKAEISDESLHHWLKEKAGYYDAYLTPSGVVKKVKSIAFDKMDQDEFNIFYKSVFSVAWRYVFTHANFENQEHAENVAQQMAAIG